MFFGGTSSEVDGGYVRIKGAKTLYLSAGHSKHTASYTG